MLLEQKRALAEQDGISFTIQTVPHVEWTFNDNETCSLLGNLLDNAIEACKRLDGNVDKWISIKIENSAGEAPVMKKGRFVSIKQDKTKHGYGLKSVE